MEEVDMHQQSTIVSRTLLRVGLLLMVAACDDGVVAAPGAQPEFEAGAMALDTTSSRVALIETSVGVARVTRVDVTPAVAQLAIGGIVQLKAETRGARGAVLPGRTVKFSSSAPSVASVSATGLVTAIGAGTVTITALSETVTGRASITVLAPAPAPAPVPPPAPTVATIQVALAASSLTVGQTTQASAQPKDGAGIALTGFTVTWASSAPSIAQVSPSGIVTATSVGTAVISATTGGKTGQAPVTVTAAPVAERVYTLPASIDASGGTDVTTPLNAFLATVPDSATVRFAAGGRYRVEGTLLLINRRSLTVDGNGATVFALTDGSGVIPQPQIAHKWPRKRSQFMFLGGENIVVRNIIVDGPNANAGTGESAFVVALEAQHAFEFSGVQGGELDRVKATDIYGDFVYFGQYGGKLTSKIWVHHSHFERNGRQGMAFTNAEDILIEDNYLAQIRRAHFDLEPNVATDVIRRITIRNNRFGPGRLLFIASGGSAGTIEDLLVENNVLTGKELIIQVLTPVGSRRSRIRIIGNTSDKSFGSAAPMMQFNRVDGLEIRGNRNPIDAHRLIAGVRVRESCNVVITGNFFVGATAEADIAQASCALQQKPL